MHPKKKAKTKKEKFHIKKPNQKNINININEKNQISPPWEQGDFKESVMLG